MSNLHAVYVPSCPYNLIPPQVLIKQMRLQAYDIQHSEHDDTKYIFNYKSSSSKCYRSVTVPLGNNGLFTLRTNEGYSSFMSRAASYNTDFAGFAGATHVIPDDEEASPSHIPSTLSDFHPIPKSSTTSSSEPGLDKTRELSIDKTREISPTPSNTREHICPPCTIPLTDSDFAPLKSSPEKESFDILDASNLQSDPKMDAVRQKQFRLLTIHERLGHVSFTILRLMAKCGLIPRELASVDPPRCPGCAYGKAHRKPCCTKG